MPTIAMDKRDLLELLGRTIDDETLKKNIPMMGTELESFDDEITVEVFPDRPDMLSVEGFALALRSFLGIKTGMYKFKLYDGGYRASIDKKVKKIRPDAVCAVITGVQLTDAAIQSLMQVQEKLHLTHGRNRKRVAIGVHDLDKIEFPLIYTTKSKDYSFVPLERSKEMSMEEILEKHEKGIAYKHLLEEYEEYPLWIDAREQVLSMPPIINSEHTRVTEKTTDLFLDVTGYGLKHLEHALNILTMSLSLRNGRIYSVDVNDADKKYRYPNTVPKKMEIDVEYTNKLLGTALRFNDISKLLKKMGYGIENKTALAPPYRADILHKVDIVEDVAIAFGFNEFKPEIPDISTIGEENPFKKFIRIVRDLITGFKLMELKNYTLTNKEDLFTKMNWKKERVVEMQNALTTEYNVLRNSLVPGLLHVYSTNTHYEYPQNVFEIGAVFRVENGTVKEETNLAVGICYERANFTECKEILSSFFKNIGITYGLEEGERRCFISGRSGNILVNSENIGSIGEIHPEVLSNWGIGMPVAVFEVNLDRIYEKV